MSEKPIANNDFYSVNIDKYKNLISMKGRINFQFSNPKSDKERLKEKLVE